ncbi:MAG: hypothetical protein P8Y97_13475 [Candidatus Lokiarchaeota archaeon]
MKDKVIGLIVMILGIVIAIFYTMGSVVDLYFSSTIGGAPNWDSWSYISYTAMGHNYTIDWLNWKVFVVVPVWLLIILICVIAIWIGYSMLTTPAPVPLEELEEELAAEEEEEVKEE